MSCICKECVCYYKNVDNEVSKKMSVSGLECSLELRPVKDENVEYVKCSFFQQKGA